jgi:TolB-like protein/Flp pilus assembly protein TadD
MIYRFADCELDTRRFELRRRGVVRPIEPQVLQLLLYLIEHRDRVVTRAEIYASIWNGRLVSEASVYSRVKSARAATGDDGRSQAVIRTLQRTGYRFVAELIEPKDDARGLGPAAGSREDVEKIVASGDDLDNLALTPPTQPSVAVLPFRADGADFSQQMLADGLTDDVITRIGRTRSLFVVARGSTFKFRAGPYDAREIGRALGVRYVVQGNLQESGKKLRIAAVLESAAGSCELWADHFHRNLDDIFAIQDEIATLVVGAVEAEIEGAERERAASLPATSLDAWTAYHRGCWHMYRFTAADFDRAEHFFGTALQLDPRASRAYAGLSFIHWQRAFLELTPDRRLETERAMAFAEQGLALDPRDPLARWAVGRAYLLRGDLDQAVDELEASVTLNPSSAAAQYSLAYALMHGDQTERSNDVVGRARRLSPYDPLTYAMYAVRAQNLSFLGRYDESAAFATRAAREPNAHHHVVAIAAFCNALAGRGASAKEHYHRLRSIRPGYGARDFFRAFQHRCADHAALIGDAFRRLETFA